MNKYEKMYFELMRAQLMAIEILQDAHREAEQMLMEDEKEEAIDRITLLPPPNTQNS